MRGNRESLRTFDSAVVIQFDGRTARRVQESRLRGDRIHGQ
jgi:hypothetical protein